jgi:peptidoglycan/xylan/chitin deacetylase (PgdA/CDA1 family)
MAVRHKKWFFMFLGAALGLILSAALLNLAADPFGVFGDRLMHWYAADMTNNPRTAKIAWLNARWDDYDGYLIGSSVTSSYPAELLNAYTGGSFYNLTVYGSDLYDTREILRYVLANDDPRTVFISLDILNAVDYRFETDPLTGCLDWRVDGSDPAAFYLRFLFANPRYGLAKLWNRWNDSYLQQPYDVYLPETGAYDKSVRDAERIGNPEEYRAANPDFLRSIPPGTLDARADFLRGVREIKAMCADAGVRVHFLFAPMYEDLAESFDPADLADLWTDLAAITDFWDFALSSVSADDRYFYDPYHFRNCVGEMAINRIFGRTDFWIPEDFGVLTTADNAAARAEIFFSEPVRTAHTAAVPILLYHDVTADGAGEFAIAAADFEAQMAALVEAGWTAVSFAELCDYVYRGADLPAKSLAITFDDGYAGVCDYAYPILEKHGLCATVFLIGVSSDRETYKDTGRVLSHLSAEQERTLAASGRFAVENHSFDMHQVAGLDAAPIREGALPLPGETETAFIEAFRADYRRCRDLILSHTGWESRIYAYPHGEYSLLSEVLLRELGARSTVTTEERSNTIVKGLPQSLFALGRFRAEALTADRLVNLLETAQ